ncbi:phage holin family protein [Candidatus Saccharibacteria bacterium]|nr:phage holin family protein [Candidatus Saccharibacteria bacterium]
MVKQQILFFLIRWLVSSTAMWLCINLFGTITGEQNIWLYAAAGLIFSLVNTFVKPLATLISLPLIILTLGLFSVIVNVAMVALAIWLLPGVQMTFWGVVGSTIVLSLINGLVNFLVPAYNEK